MSKSFATERCVPWLFSQAGVRIEGDPEPAGPGLHTLHGRIPPRSAFWLKFLGVAGLFVAAVAFMIGVRPARDPEAARARTVAPAVGAAFSGLSIGAIAYGRRLERTAPALEVLCAARGANPDESELASLASRARRRLADRSWPEGHLWMVSETPLPTATHACATKLQIRCFTAIDGRIVEV